MSAITIAVMSHGIFVTSGPTTAPSPFDVRVGVDNGDGDLGTLTSPPVYDVRAGVQYGGDGTQYTGTLYVPSASGGNSWTEEMLELWHDEAAESEFMATMQYQSWMFICIKNPVRSGFQMTQTGYNYTADSIIDMLRSDAVASGLYPMIVQQNPQSKRPVVKVNGIDYDLLSLENDDETQPSIRIFAVKHQ